MRAVQQYSINVLSRILHHDVLGFVVCVRLSLIHIAHCLGVLSNALNHGVQVIILPSPHIATLHISAVGAQLSLLVELTHLQTTPLSVHPSDLLAALDCMSGWQVISDLVRYVSRDTL